MSRNLVEELYIKISGDASQLTSTLNKAAFQTENTFRKTATMVGVVGASLASATALIVGASVREFARFDTAMTDSLATMIGVNSRIRKDMENTARSIAMTTNLTAVDVAQGYKGFADSGFDAASAMKMLPAAVAYATANMVSATVATSNLVDMMSLLSLRTEDAEENLKNVQRISNVVTQAGRLTNQSGSIMMDAILKKGVGAGGLAGRDLEKTTALLMAFAKAGTKGAEAGEMLVQAERDLMTRAQANSQIFKAYGLAVFDNAGKMRHMADIVDDLDIILGRYTDTNKKAVLTQLGFQDKILQSLVTLKGRGQYIRDAEEALRKVGGVASEISAARLKSFSNQITLTRHKANDLAITLGEIVAPSLLLFNKELDGAFSKDKNGFSALQSEVESFGESFSSVLWGAVTVIGGLAKAFLDLKSIATLTFTALGQKQGEATLSKALNKSVVRYNKMAAKDAEDFTNMRDAYNRLGENANKVEKDMRGMKEGPEKEAKRKESTGYNDQMTVLRGKMDEAFPHKSFRYGLDTVGASLAFSPEVGGSGKTKTGYTETPRMHKPLFGTEYQLRQSSATQDALNSLRLQNDAYTYTLSNKKSGADAGEMAKKKEYEIMEARKKRQDAFYKRMIENMTNPPSRFPEINKEPGLPVIPYRGVGSVNYGKKEAPFEFGITNSAPVLRDIFKNVENFIKSTTALNPASVVRRIKEEDAWKAYDEQAKTKDFSASNFQVRGSSEFQRRGLGTNADGNIMRVEEKQLKALEAIKAAIDLLRSSSGPPGFVYSE